MRARTLLSIFENLPPWPVEVDHRCGLSMLTEGLLGDFNKVLFSVFSSLERYMVQKGRNGRAMRECSAGSAAAALWPLVLAVASAATADPYCAAVLHAGDGLGGPGTSLAMAVVVARHGDRTPVNILPDEGAVTWDGCGALRTDTVPRSKAKTFSRVLHLVTLRI